MTAPALAPALGRSADRITLAPGDHACIPVPEGQVVLRYDDNPTQGVVVLKPHSGEPYELARFVHGSITPPEMVTVALAALDGWR